MIIPMRCFSCGKLIADKWEEFNELLRDYDENEALNALGLDRYCCRRMLLTHVDFSDMLLRFNPADNRPADAPAAAA